MFQEQDKKIIRETKKQLLKNGYLSEGSIRDIIMRSWKRSFDNNVDFYQRKASIILSPQDFAKKIKENKSLFDISRPVMIDLHKFVEGSGFVIALTDSEGYILEILGDKGVIDDAAQGNLIAGSLWSENTMGTCGVGTALVEKVPLQVIADEHFCLLARRWTCYASPIFDAGKNVIGSIGMAARNELSHLHSLGMVVAAAKAIEKQLILNETLNSYKITNQFLTTIMDSMNDGLITIDYQGKITHLNRSMAKILQVIPSDVIGISIEELTNGINEHFTKLIYSEDEVIDQEVEVNLKHGKQAHLIFSSINIIAPTGNAGRVIIVSEQKRIRRVAQHLAGVTAKVSFEDLIGNSQLFRETLEIAERAAYANSNILILGESGTGKDILAQAIHNQSDRAEEPFVAVNCAALPRDLIASELFGYSEGAFTGARKDGNAGKFELAEGGTIFLDEIGDMPLVLQTNLLRVIESKSLMRVGGNKIIPVNVRIISATNKDLPEEVEKGNFRKDLYYRLNILIVKIPPLRERPEDIPVLLDHFIKKMAKQFGMPPLKISFSVGERLNRYHWPGNVRQLQNLVERAYNTGKGTMILPEIDNVNLPEIKHSNSCLKNIEVDLIKSLLNQDEKNIAEIARSLGVARSTVYRKMKKHSIKRIGLS